jgi:hypothetical protein
LNILIASFIKTNFIYKYAAVIYSDVINKTLKTPNISDLLYDSVYAVFLLFMYN